MQVGVALGTLYVFYDLSQRLTVRAQAGERAAVVGASLKKALESVKSKPKEVVQALPRGQVVMRARTRA